MPYKFETDWLKIRKENDRRIKLSDSDKEEIKELIWKWLSYKEIWDKYSVHRKTIYLIDKPLQALKEKEEFKIRRLDWRYYNKEKHTQAIKKTRENKKELNNKNLLIK